MITETLLALALLAVTTVPLPVAQSGPFGFARCDQVDCSIEAEGVSVKATGQLCMLEGTTVTLDENAGLQSPVRRATASVQRHIIEHRCAVPGH